jgi:hypothetical protein
MNIKIDQETVAENQDFMLTHKDSYPVHVIRARVKSIELVDGEYRWVEFDINSKGDYIKGTAKVLNDKVSWVYEQ